jgi:DUF1680 family protein
MPALLLFAIAAAIAAGLSGDDQDRFGLALERVLHGGPPRYSVEFVTADAVPRHVRRFTEFSGDVSGRYLEALAVCARDRAELRPRVDAVADAVVVHQKADGHFGDPFADGPITPKHMAVLWGNGRLLVGLMEAHRLTGRADLLESARRLGGFFLAIAPRMNDEAVRREYSGTQVAVGYICWTQIVEGLVSLNEATRDTRYLELARQVAARTTRHPSQHSHGYLTSLRGILRLHEATGDASLLAQVEREWEELVASGNVFVQGAVPEAFKPMATRDEGCSEADWLRLNLALWRATAKPRYLENAELTLFNEFAFNQFSSGDFGHRVLTGEGVSAVSARAWWCCTFHGLRAYPDVFRAAFRGDAESLRFDLPVSGEGRAGGLVMSAISSLGANGTVTLRVTAAPASARRLSIRVPAWADRIGVSLNGRPLEGSRAGAAWETSRVWRPGEVIAVHYVFGTRTVESPADPSRLAIFHGPWLLGIDAHDSPSFFDEPSQENRVVLEKAGDGLLRLNTAQRRPAGARRFTAPAAHFSLQFLPGGYPVQPQTALLRPIADQTSLPDATSWVFWFRAADLPPALTARR